MLFLVTFLLLYIDVSGTYSGAVRIGKCIIHASILRLHWFYLMNYLLLQKVICVNARYKNNDR